VRRGGREGGREGWRELNKGTTNLLSVQTETRWRRGGREGGRERMKEGRKECKVCST
jgi:hypothetical protein